MKEVTQVKLSPGKVIKPEGFKKAFDKMPYDSRKDVRGQICALCFWGVSTFQQKVYGIVPFRIYEVEQITAYFAERGIDAWTGDLLNN